jgi:hypothetical protein
MVRSWCSVRGKQPPSQGRSGAIGAATVCRGSVEIADFTLFTQKRIALRAPRVRGGPAKRPSHGTKAFAHRPYAPLVCVCVCVCLCVCVPCSLSAQRHACVAEPSLGRMAWARTHAHRQAGRQGAALLSCQSVPAAKVCTLTQLNPISGSVV